MVSGTYCSKQFAYIKPKGLLNARLELIRGAVTSLPSPATDDSLSHENQKKKERKKKTKANTKKRKKKERRKVT